MRISDWSSDACSSVLQLQGIDDPSADGSSIPWSCCPLSPATRTMKNSSRLLPEIDRKRSRSSSGCAGLRASSITRRLTASHDSSRLKKRSGPKEEAVLSRSEARRVGKECVSTCRSRWPQSHSKHKTNYQSATMSILRQQQ